MINRFQSCIDSIQESSKFRLIALPILMFVTINIIAFLFGMAYILIISVIAIIKNKVFHVECFISGTNFSAFIIYILLFIISIILVKVCSKKKFNEIGINKENGIEFFVYGSLIGTGIITLIFILIFFSNSILITVNKNVSYSNIMIAFLVFFIIELGEQIMTRNYLLTFLAKAIGIKKAIILLSTLTAFLIFLAKGLKISDIETLILLTNSFLSTTIFSLIYYYIGNMWLVVGISAFISFFGTAIFGSTMHSAYVINALLNYEVIWEYTILNGGKYGFEAGIFTSIVYIGIILFLLHKINEEKKMRENIYF